MKPIDGRVNMTDGKPVKTDVVLRCQVSGLSDSSYEALKWSFKGQMLTNSDKYNISAADNAIMIKNAGRWIRWMTTLAQGQGCWAVQLSQEYCKSIIFAGL